MISGGLIGGGDWCIGDYCTSPSIIGEAFSDAAKATYDNVIEPTVSGIATAAVSTYDFFDTVSSGAFWNYYLSEPSRIGNALWTNWFGDSAHPEKKLLAVLPFLPLAIVYGIPAVATATAGTGIFGGLIFGGSAACTWHSSSAGNTQFSASSNESCSEFEMSMFHRWQEMCRSNGGQMRIISNRTQGGECDIEATCDM